MTATDDLNLTFSAVFLFGFVILVAAELVGVASKRKGDTITENWYWVRNHLSGPLRWFWIVFTAGLLTWALFHFLG